MRRTEEPSNFYVPNPFMEMVFSGPGNIPPKRISKNGEESVVKLTRSFVENGLTVQEIRDLEIESDVFIELLDLGFLRQNYKGTFDFVEVPDWLSEWYNGKTEKIFGEMDWPRVGQS